MLFSVGATMFDVYCGKEISGSEGGHTDNAEPTSD